MVQTLKLSARRKVEWDYDPEVDVLMVQIGKSTPAVSYDAGNGLLIRYDEKSGEILGFEILNANAKIITKYSSRNRRRAK